MFSPEGGCPLAHRGCPLRALAEGGIFMAEAANEVGAVPGERVVVKMESPHYYQALVLAFGVPVLGMFAGYAAGAALGGVAGMVGEGPGIAGAGLALALAFVAMRYAGRNCEPRYTVVGKAEG